MKLKWNFLSAKSVTNSSVCIQQKGDGLSVAYKKSNKIITHYINEPKENQRVKLQSYIQQQGLRLCDCHYVLSENQYRLMLLDIPKMPEDEVHLALPWLVKDLIDLPLEEVGLDAFLLPLRQESGDKIYVVIADLQKLQEIKHFIRDAGLSLKKIDILELALLPILRKISQQASIGHLGLIYTQDKNIHLMLSNSEDLYFSRKVGHLSQLDSQQEKERLVLELQRSLDFCQVQLKQPAPQELLLEPSLHGVITSDEQLTVPIRDLTCQSLPDIYEAISPEDFNLSMVTIGEVLASEAAC